MMYDATLGEATIADLRESVRGAVLTPTDEGYDEARLVWNGMYDDRRPAVIVRCAGAADVIAALGFARANDLPLAVRGGGHSVAGFSTCDGGLVIDLSPLRAVHVDPVRRRATVGGGAVWADVDHETQAHGLATTGGLVSSTGVGGFTLGGGVGWTMRRHGLACDNLLSAEVVTADGTLVHASADENAELFWGLRGGGGNFGVVTQFEFALHPVGPLVYAGAIFFPPELDAPLLELFRDWAPGAPDDVTLLVNLTTAPPLPPIPAEWHGRPVAALVGMWCGAVDEGAALLAPFRKLGEPVADLFGPMPYGAMQTLIDPLWPKGLQAYFKAANLRRVDDATIAALVPLHLDAPGPQCEIHVHQMGGAVALVAEEATAFGDRSMPFLVNAVTGWREPADADSHIAWARRVVDAVQPAATGRSYVNFTGEADAAGTYYAAEALQRLRAVKAQFDPLNVLRLNQNVAVA
jgi:FAD/FMN-containing dehydrogenase